MKSSASLPAAFTVCTTEAPSGYLWILCISVSQTELFSPDRRETERHE